MNARPFLKWAGGKGQLLSTFRSYYPLGLWTGQIVNYVEPFVGGGAVFFDLFSKFQFETIVLNEINKEVYLSYKTIRDEVEPLVAALRTMETEFHHADTEERRRIYYRTREEFNAQKACLDQLDPEQCIRFVADLVFLNRTCFNGLFRQNSKGEFNVPMGSYARPTICDAENLRLASRALQDVVLRNCDFEETLDHLHLEPQRTFIYLDPPYRPLPNSNNFTNYASSGFGDDSQRRLAEWFFRLHSEGHTLMLSNSDPTSIDQGDLFFEKLYERFPRHRVLAARAINCKSNSRGAIPELLVTNYRVQSVSNLFGEANCASD